MASRKIHTCQNKAKNLYTIYFVIGHKRYRRYRIQKADHRKERCGINGVLGHQKSTQKTVPKHGCARKASWIIVVPLMTQRGNRSHATFTMHDVASVCNSAFTAHSTVPKPSRFSCISDPITTGRPLNALVDKWHYLPADPSHVSIKLRRLDL